jgi:GNAT superfamily N-acetyltransferase
MQRETTAYDEFWSRFFGLDVAQLQSPGVTVVAHAHLADYPGIWFFERRASVVVSAPSEWVERLRGHADRLVQEPLPSSTLLREMLGGEPARVIGPAYQGYLSPGAFRPVRDPNVRRLGSQDEPALLDLRSVCSVEEWEHSALSMMNEPVFGYFLGGELVAAAGSDHWTREAVNPGVLSRPDQRGRGFGAAVVSALVEAAMASGKLPLYQTLTANAASVGLCERLGYRHYGTHLAVRLGRQAAKFS